MVVEIKVPSLGESINEVFIGKWLKQPGERVREDEPLVELESDKATQELPAPVSGVLQRILKQDGETAGISEVIAYLDDAAAATDASKPAESATTPSPSRPPAKPSRPPQPERPVAAPRPAAPPRAAAAPRTSAPAPVQPASPAAVATAAQDGPLAARSTQASTAPPTMPASEIVPEVPSEPTAKSVPGPAIRVMPAAQRMLDEAGLRAEDVPASGPGGRLLKEDVERHLTSLRRETPAATQGQRPTPAEKTSDRGDKIMPMSPMRRTIAQRLVQAQQTAALLTTFNEIDMTAVLGLRNRYREPFQERHGLKLGFMAFFVKAVVDALKTFPQINAEIRGTDIVYHHYFDIGIAIGSGSKGLVVPVLRNADTLSFAEIETAVADFGKRARENRIDLEELKGGTFTISNGGIYGSLLSTPIVNPPQSGILGLHAIQDRPVAVEGQVVIRPMMYAALTYDHRLVDGREAVTFLRRVKECIEEPSRLLMEI